MRAMTLEGWDWPTILTRVWVAVLMMTVLLEATMWMYRRQTAYGEHSLFWLKLH